MVGLLLREGGLSLLQFGSLLFQVSSMLFEVFNALFELSLAPLQITLLLGELAILFAQFVALLIEFLHLLMQIVEHGVLPRGGFGLALLALLLALSQLFLLAGQVLCFFLQFLGLAGQFRIALLSLRTVAIEFFGDLLNLLRQRGLDPCNPIVLRMQEGVSFSRCCCSVSENRSLHSEVDVRSGSRSSMSF